MKNFVKENWYKLMIGSSLFIFSVGFFINSVSPVYSINTDKTNNSLKVLPNNQKVIQVPVNEDGSVSVKLSEEQMKELKSIQSISGERYVDNGFLYIFTGWELYHYENSYYWKKYRLP